jgi:hypothetical protein
MTLNLGNDAALNEISLEEVDVAALSGVGPFDVELYRYPIVSDDRFGDPAIDALRKESIECSDHVRSAAALIGTVVVAPSGIFGQHSSKKIEILRRERGLNPVRDLVDRPQLDREVEAAALGGVARDDADPPLDKASAVGAVHLHA